MQELRPALLLWEENDVQYRVDGRKDEHAHSCPIRRHGQKTTGRRTCAKERDCWRTRASMRSPSGNWKRSTGRPSQVKERRRWRRGAPVFVGLVGLGGGG